jgi:hypothetical protein
MLIRKMQPAKIVALGMILTGVASAVHWYLQRHSGWSESATDFTSGALQGVAIATMLIGIWLQGCSRRKDR